MKKGTTQLFQGLLCLIAGAVISTTALAAAKSRIISLSPAATELLYELHLENHLIAVDQNSNYPEAAKQLPNIGDPFNPNLELLAKYQPDFLIHFSQNAVLDIAQNMLNLSLWPMQPRNMEELFEHANSLNEKFGTKNTQQIAQWRQQWENINKEFKNKPHQKVFIFLGANPIYTLGKEAFLSQSLHACNVSGLFDNQNYASLLVSEEQLLIHPPEKVLAGLSVHEDPNKRTQDIINTFARFGITLTPKQIVLMNQDILFRPTIRFLNHLPDLCKRLQDS